MPPKRKPKKRTATLAAPDLTIPAECHRCRTCDYWCVVRTQPPYKVPEGTKVDPMTLTQECRGAPPAASNRVTNGGGWEPYRAWPQTDPDDGERCGGWKLRQGVPTLYGVPMVLDPQEEPQ